MDGVGLVTQKFKAHNLDEVYRSGEDMDLQVCDDGLDLNLKANSTPTDEGIYDQENRHSGSVPVDAFMIPTSTSRSASGKRPLQLVSDRANMTPDSDAHCFDAPESGSTIAPAREGSRFQTFTRYPPAPVMIFTELDRCCSEDDDDRGEVEDINCGAGSTTTTTSQVRDGGRSSTAALDEEVCDLLSPLGSSFPVGSGHAFGGAKLVPRLAFVGGTESVSYFTCPAGVSFKSRFIGSFRRGQSVSVDQATVIPRPSLDFEKMQRISFGRKRIHKGIKKPRVVRARSYKISISSLPHPRAVFIPSSCFSFRSLSLSLGYGGCFTSSSSSVASSD